MRVHIFLYVFSATVFASADYMYHRMNSKLSSNDRLVHQQETGHYLYPPVIPYNKYRQTNNYYEQSNGGNLESYSNSKVQPIVTKDIYINVAPEVSQEHLAPAILKMPTIPRKHYRIIFIKAPTPSVNKATVNIKEEPTEEKTIIYVLSKKPEPLHLETAYKETPIMPNKPEVHFIKYKTKEEAELAQKHIQAHYDKLGGTTRFSDEGVAPVTSVVGTLEASVSAKLPYDTNYAYDKPKNIEKKET